jgi:hypothetical protein
VAAEELVDLYSSTNDSSDGVVASLLLHVLSSRVDAVGDDYGIKQRLHRHRRLTVAYILMPVDLSIPSE